MHNHAFSKILILIIFIVLAGGGIFAWQYWWMPKEGAKDETADWKIFQNEEVGYEIKYPINLMEEYKPFGVGEFYKQDRNTLELKPTSPSANLVLCYIVVTKNKENFNVQQWVDQLATVPKMEIVKVNEMIVDGIEARKLLLKQYPSDVDTPLETIDRVYIVKGDFIYTLDCWYEGELKEYDHNLFEPLLSTFRFIEVDETANWKTYSNEEYGFEIKYPEDLEINEVNEESAFFEYTRFHVFRINNLNPVAATEISVYVDSDEKNLENCFSAQGKGTSQGTKIINGFEFHNWAGTDAAMGGARGIMNNYAIIYNNKCYQIDSDIRYRDLDFVAGATGGTVTQEERQEQENQIKNQKELVSSILSTFRFIEVTKQAEEISKEKYCEEDTDCACGVHKTTRGCFYGNKDYVDTTQQCPDFCTGITGKLKIKCINNECKQVSE